MPLDSGELEALKFKRVATRKQLASLGASQYSRRLTLAKLQLRMLLDGGLQTTPGYN